jgi:2-polyprenyl-3-methyl-5-hydroxy-6-metoxy-1,4-benzoquinol methylase
VNGFAVVQCPCGLARTVLPEGFDTSSIYTEDYFHGGHKDGYADYEASGDELRHEFRRILESLTPHVSGGKLLDVGCAYGFFLEEAQKKFTSYGVEISDHARNVCRERGFEVAAAATPEWLAEKGPFDAAVMLDALEHMQDPGSLLDTLHAAMRPGAQLVITTGDFGSAIARAMGKHWRLMTPPQHLWFFSPATVTALLERHGFRVHTVDHPWKLVPVSLMMYQATRYLGGQGLVRRLMPRGRVPINLFDAMRVIAERIDSTVAEDATGYAFASRHAHGRVLDMACGLGAGTRVLAQHGHDLTEVVGIDANVDHVERAIAAANGTTKVRFQHAAPTTYFDRDGFDTIVALEPPSRSVDPELVIVRAIAALRPSGLLITPGSLRAIAERYGLREVDRAGDATIAWQRAA